MKIILISDIHGSMHYMEKAMAVIDKEQPDRILMIGDALYHGPRNPLPKGYAPSEVALSLNQYKDKVIAVRGNCDSEVDQMLITYPMMADYTILFINGRKWFVTHGHVYSPEQLPELSRGDVFVSGHTHIPVAEDRDGISILNPGSIALPKGGYANSYGIVERDMFRIKDFEGNVIKKLAL
ncbi:phosphoesterase [Fulvitalea axinellae]|uniref:Phosphoesterase n=1 Tax=Fulvitalea axinellae TaxID=1182444 RepID=A0AAU9D7J8_9BACT|nr:phosphoesterase [Fulvitalea axinellae]